jgi:hypothetical protein
MLHMAKNIFSIYELSILLKLSILFVARWKLQLQAIFLWYKHKHSSGTALFQRVVAQLAISLIIDVFVHEYFSLYLKQSYQWQKSVLRSCRYFVGSKYDAKDTKV